MLPVTDTVAIADGSQLILANLWLQFKLFGLGENAAIVGVYLMGNHATVCLDSDWIQRSGHGEIINMVVSRSTRTRPCLFLLGYIIAEDVDLEKSACSGLT